MNRLKIYLIGVFTLSSLYLYGTEYFTTRGKAIGDGFVAYSFGCEGLVYNAGGAGLYCDYPEIIVEYDDLLPQIRNSLSLNRQLLGFVFPYNFSSQNFVFGGMFFKFNSDIYNESIYQLLAAKDITNLLVKDKEKLKYIKTSVGLRLKYMEYLYPSNELLENDPVFENYGRAKSVFSQDLGFLYSNADKYYFGVNIYDLLEPNIVFHQSSQLKRKLILSFAYKYIIEDKNIELVPLVGIRNYFNNTDFSLGVEISYKNSCFIRTNYSSWNVAVGIGYLYQDKLQINYTYVILNELNTTGGHYVSLGYKFVSNKKPKQESSLKSTETTKQIEKKEESLQQEIKSSDIKDTKTASQSLKKGPSKDKK